MPAHTELVIEKPGDVTAEWLTAVLGATVSDFTVERIGTGQMSECYRITPRYEADAGPDSVVLKVAAGDPTSRQTGLALGLYEREVRFYTDIAPRLAAGAASPVAPCLHSAFDPATGIFDLVLGDAALAGVGDEIRGATVDQAVLAVSQLGGLHTQLLGDDVLAGTDWLNRDAPINQLLIGQLYAAFADRYAEVMTDDQRTVCERLVAGFDDYLVAEGAEGRPMGLVHGDYRLDNMLFGAAGSDRPLTVVDWQTVTWGPALTDLAYFIGSALPVAERRQHYDVLLRAYHDALGSATALSLDDVRDGVRRQSFFGVMMAIVSSMLVERTARGDEMFMTMLDRHCSHVLDTDALAALPSAAPTVPLRPEAADEGAHPSTDEPLWSESWYWDFVDPTQGVGGWLRLGLIPNQQTAWLQALLCGPDMPTIAVSEFAAPLPGNPATLNTDTFEFAHAATTPLQRYTVTVRGRGEAFDDPAALLRGEAGRPVEVMMDLQWTSDGTPYRYRITPRYEIPCAVSGVATADGHTYTFAGVPGQRDHSWGVRDWWSMEWVWSALHLDDGTHLHGVDMRIPGIPPFGIGYVQTASEDATGPLVELQGVSAREVFSPNELPVSTELTLTADGSADVVATAQIVGHAPVRLTAPDGRVSFFPRAWATVTTADGRTGVGWLEWNRNQ
ncbi:ecdysteroid 22-kinase family protein [Mycolicibacterium komossense]|uniref:Phosphotransferase n=1 Tax=Mycolicibacterium komossense TaxID=1779 RepID=A0ABT3C827_9MYCO|nr:ecdysteroid 22-kinase family protein [Mycolicibacterium komossense]MCV7225608.1 phosphotransferase [Mycolicibacterium komossense]